MEILSIVVEFTSVWRKIYHTPWHQENVYNLGFWGPKRWEAWRIILQLGGQNHRNCNKSIVQLFKEACDFETFAPTEFSFFVFLFFFLSSSFLSLFSFSFLFHFFFPFLSVKLYLSHGISMVYNAYIQVFCILVEYYTSICTDVCISM